MTKQEWKEWQKEILYEEYVKPDLSHQILLEKLKEVNKKYHSHRALAQQK